MDHILSVCENEFAKIFEHIKTEYSRLQAGRASAHLVEGIQVDSYGTKQPLKAVGSISIPDAKTIQIQPWDKSQLQTIEKAILVSDIGLTPINDGVVIRLSIPPLTEERRKDLVKVVHKLAEEARISIRHSRQKALDGMKAIEKEGKATEDQVKNFEKKLQEKVDKANQEIELIAKNKEKEVMTI